MARPDTTLPPDVAVYLTHHIFLPPKLPQQDDYNSLNEIALLHTFSEALSSFISLQVTDDLSTYESLRWMVTNIVNVHDGYGHIDEPRLEAALQELCKNGGILPIHVYAQNAGILFRNDEGFIYAETFEISPLNGPVIQTLGRIRRLFPGRAVRIPLNIFNSPELFNTVAHTLSKMSHQPVIDTKPATMKAEKCHDETRDTTHPRMITELFFGFLLSFGEPVEVPCIWKNTRDEVLYANSLLPWHRSPIWLFLRVCMQLNVSRHKKPDLYKNFLVFFMAYVLDHMDIKKLSQDMIYILQAKVSRRLMKLGLIGDEPWLEYVHTTLNETSKVLQSRWTAVISANTSQFDMSALETLEFEKDIFCQLPALDHFIKSIDCRSLNSANTVTGIRQFPIDLPPKWLPKVSISDEDESRPYNICAVETWIAKNLNEWLDGHIEKSNPCQELETLITSYHKSSSTIYANNPEALSQMILTILELWIACDKVALHAYPMLSQYDIEIPEAMFDCLLLTTKHQLHRLRTAQQYLISRKTMAIYASPNIFSNYGGPESFPVRYFDESTQHQELRASIESHASQERLRKCAELKEKKKEYSRLMMLHEESECTCRDINFDDGCSVMSQNETPCDRCQYKITANKIQIPVHEWPLPRDEDEAKTVVFEIQVPASFLFWRNATVYVLFDVFGAKYGRKANPRRKLWSLRDYSGLSDYRQFIVDTRIGLTSVANPHVNTHYNEKTINLVQEQDICVNNGLVYQYFDFDRKCFVNPFRFGDSMASLCMYKLPSRSSSLQKFLLRCGRESKDLHQNEVIATQWKCPTHATLEEYKALASIPLGFRIQWQNILLQLAMPSVDFKKLETNLVILQTIFQAGPSSTDTVLGQGHLTLEDEVFASTLLSEIGNATERIKQNWECHNGLSVFISLTLRVLTLSPSRRIHQSCLTTLSLLRDIALQWANCLRDRAEKATKDAQKDDLSNKVFRITLICVNSFDCDDAYLGEVLRCERNASIFFECSILIQEKLKASEIDITTLLLLHRWRQLSLRSFSILSEDILKRKGKSLDVAISRSWPAYVVESEWNVSRPANHWLKKTYLGDRQLFFNFLNGQFLVCGHPLTHLPHRYTKHETVQTLFGRADLDVMPSHVAGMEFSGKKEFSGYTFHLGLVKIRSSSRRNKFDFQYEVLVQASIRNETFELIPRRVLSGHFPIHYIEDYIHWYDIKNDCIEFRSIQNPWESSPLSWRLKHNAQQWYLTSSNSSFLNLHSRANTVISNILKPLEDNQYIHCSFFHDESVVEINLPRLHLQFYMYSRKPLIHSRQFRGMSIDRDQSLGTLIGLENKLLLVGTNTRLLLLPEGDVTFKAAANHSKVEISKTSAGNRRAYSYYVDNRLGRLLDNGSLQSKLFLSYLHGLTSSCLPDPFLMRTGTEEALSILKSGAVWSFDRLTAENVQLLSLIAKLSPERRYYPSNLREMQTVTWATGIGFLSQHSHYLKSVNDILNHDERMKTFHRDEYVTPQIRFSDSRSLFERDCIRSATFRVSGFGAEDHTTEKDEEYISRDREPISKAGEQAFAMSNMIYRGSISLPSHLISDDMATHLYKTLEQAAGTIETPHSQISLADLKYDSNLILRPLHYVSKNWCNLYRQFTTNCKKRETFQIMLWLSAITFSPFTDLPLIHTLAALYILPCDIFPDAMPASKLELLEGTKVDTNVLRQVIEITAHSIQQCPEWSIPNNPGESNVDFQTRRRAIHRINFNLAVDKLSKCLTSQWPCEVPVAPPEIEMEDIAKYVSAEVAMREVRAKFNKWYSNYLFKQHLVGILSIIEPRLSANIASPSIPQAKPPYNIVRNRGFVSIEDLFTTRPALFLHEASPGLKIPFSFNVQTKEGAEQLNQLMKTLHDESQSQYDKVYFSRLQDSLSSLIGEPIEWSINIDQLERRHLVEDYICTCQARVESLYTLLLTNLLPSCEGFLSSRQHSPASVIAFSVSNWPRVTPLLFLQQLQQQKYSRLNDEWKDHFLSYALAIAELQRAERLLDLADKEDEFVKELRNPGHRNWSPKDFPESLLLEVENGIMLRAAQQEVVTAITSLPSGDNAVMQLNMGEGKSSVIVPILATNLANTSCLVRIIVGKPQYRQMLHILTSTLGGLLNRRIYHMPFHRAIHPSYEEAKEIQEMCRECMENGGVLLVQPEHLLSFKLMGIESRLSGDREVSQPLLQTQELFDNSSHDIIDESDDVFNPKFEVVYAMGSQRSIEFGPYRWLLIQQLMCLVKHFAATIKARWPRSVEVHEYQPGSFPRIRILYSDAQEELLERTAEYICEHGLLCFPVHRQSREFRNVVFHYIRHQCPDSQTISLTSDHTNGFWTETTRNALLMIRGLLGQGVLGYVLQKRWRVNYGLDESRVPATNLAVPYRAKDSPSARSEFSHPDVVILFTCLSYYYEGLSDANLLLAFSHLTKADQADMEYRLWVQDAPILDAHFRHLTGINLEDRSYCIENVFPALRYSKGAIDYFLSHIVFMKQMKEFPQKLSASGWDIGEAKNIPTAGFSGTNDSQDTLPLSVTQLALPNQKHVNALNLWRLLRPENSAAVIPYPNSSVSDAQNILSMVTNLNPPVQVILDVGAQILESNRNVAKEWLRMTTHTRCQAVIFFDDSDEIVVLDRTGRIESLHISPYSKQMELCHVFLDECHTRGTDLRLPQNYRAALTLGANLTKDKLAQACMRMRKLGNGHSIVFCIPSEIEIKIRLCSTKSNDVAIEVSDVLRWAISETSAEAGRSMSVWAMQGIRYQRQTRIWKDYRSRNDITTEGARKFLEDEVQTLEQRYSPSAQSGFSFLSNTEDTQAEPIIERCRLFEKVDLNSASIFEEQERELASEREQERYFQKPKPYQASTHIIDPAIKQFIATGKVKPGFFKGAFRTLGNTTAAKEFLVSDFPLSDLLVSRDFAHTIETSRTELDFVSDLYQRHAQWVLTSFDKTNTVQHMVLISPYEADALLPEIGKENCVTLHIYTPRVSIHYPPLDSLNLYTVPVRHPPPTIPESLLVQLNLFSGQLYLATYNEYLRVCEFLNLATEATREGWTVAADGFIVQRADGAPATFHTSPVKFFKLLMGQIRRHCDNIDKTHIGQILNGELLRPEDFSE